MSDLVTLILRMSQDVRMLKACVSFCHKVLQHKHQNHWLDDQEVVQKFRISIRTLRRLRQKGKLPFTHFYGKIFYKRQDLDRLLEVNYSKQKKVD